MQLQIIKIVTFLALLTAGGFACSKDGKTDDDKLVSIQIKNWKGEVDPFVVSFALPGIVDARCYNSIPNPNFIGFPEEWGINDWSIHLVMEKGTDRTKLVPIITLAHGVTITPKSGTVLDFSKKIEWTLRTPDGSTVNYYMTSIHVIGDTDEANMIPVKIRCCSTGAVDPNIVSFALPGIVSASIYEFPPYPNYGGNPEAWSPHEWTIILSMAKGTDCSKLAPIIKLASDVVLIVKPPFDEQLFSKEVDYTGIADVGVLDFSKKVEFFVIKPDGSTVTYSFFALTL